MGVYGDDESVNTDKASDTNELKESVYGVYDVYDTTLSSATSNDLETKVNDSLTKVSPVGKVSSLDKLLSSIQEKGDDRMEILNLKVETVESEQKPSQPSIPKSPPADWSAWLETATGGQRKIRRSF